MYTIRALLFELKSKKKINYKTSGSTLHVHTRIDAYEEEENSSPNKDYHEIRREYPFNSPYVQNL